MADQQRFQPTDRLTEEQFEAALRRVIESSPTGLSEDQFNKALADEVAKAEAVAASHGASGSWDKMNYAQYGPMSQLMRDAYEPEQARKNFKENLPNTMAMAATMGLTAVAPPLGAYTIPAMAATAGMGGTSGALLRGDQPRQALWEGGKQALLEGSTLGTQRVVGGLAPRVYKEAIPKNILDKFKQANIPRAGLEARALVGTKQALGAAERGNVAANKVVQEALPTVQPLRVRDLEAAFDPRRARMTLANKPGKVSEIDEYVQQIRNEYAPPPSVAAGPTSSFSQGPGGSFSVGAPSRPAVNPSDVMIDPAAQLARKEALEEDSKGAVQAVSQRMVATNPKLANIERKAVLKNLRQSDEMRSALNRSQSNVGLARAADAQQNASALKFFSPAVMSGAGIAMNEASKVMRPDVARLLLSLMSQRSNVEPEE